VALFILLPQLGILGAALASLLGYAGVSAMLLVQAVRAATIRSWTTLWPTGEDLGAVWGRLVGAMRGPAR
jgi:Na+-driven multidrug efflux pump